MEFNELTDEQKAKVSACKTPQELVALAAEEGVELTDEQIEAISGGSEWYEPAPCSPDDFRPIPLAASAEARLRLPPGRRGRSSPKE